MEEPAPIVKSEIAKHFAHHDEHTTHERTELTEQRKRRSRSLTRTPYVDTTVYTHPLPSVLMLTAIVVVLVPRL